MEISVSDAKASLTEFLHRAEAGEEVVLTRRGQKPAQIVPLKPAPFPEKRRALIEEIRAMAPKKSHEETSAARSQDFLYGEDGLPELLSISATVLPMPPPASSNVLFSISEMTLPGPTLRPLYLDQRPDVIL